MVLNTIFNNISIISWRSVVLVEVNGVPGEIHRPVGSHWQTLSHNVVSSTPRHEQDSNTQRLLALMAPSKSLTEYVLIKYVISGYFQLYR